MLDEEGLPEPPEKLPPFPLIILQEPLSPAPTAFAESVTEVNPHVDISV